MNTSMLSCFQSSPPNPTGGVVRGVKLSFLQDAIPLRMPIHSTGNIFDISRMIDDFYFGLGSSPSAIASGGSCNTLLLSPGGIEAIGVEKSDPLNRYIVIPSRILS